SHNPTEKFIKSKYLSFCFQKNLFLNFDFGIYYDRESIKDTFTPTFIESSKETRSINQLMSDQVYISFQLFNQIIEAYTSARFSFFHASSSNTSKYDKLIRYSYTYDGIRHSYHSGLLKQVFCYLYNILDKIAHLVYGYFNVNQIKQNKDIYFNSLLSSDFKKIVTTQHNYQLLALINLALDFEKGYEFYFLRSYRNKITHSFLNTKIDIFLTATENEHEVTEENLLAYTEKMFFIVKCAIMYSTLALSHQKNQESSLLNPILFQKDIF
ncbi:MAG: LA2681 family HEPN domain-containing protein, partial [Moraxellaceae bacterium]